MPVLEPVVATLIANTEEFTASLDAAQVKMEELGAAAAGSSAESDLGGIGAAGRKAGDDVKAGAEDAAGGLRDVDTAAKDAGNSTKETGGLFNLLGGALSGLPGPMGEVADHSGRMRSGFEEATKNSNGLLGSLGSLPTPIAIAGAAIAAVGVVTVDMASKYQTATDKIAANEGITTAAAAKVGAAFLTTAGQSTFSASEIAGAFAAVSGQAKEINGSALTAKQSLDLMQSSMDLAEASGTNLSSATSDVTGTLQSFGLGIQQSPLVTNVLYNAANTTGNSVDSLSSALQRAKAQMGVAAPPVQDLGALLLDLAQHGEKGRAGISALGSAFTGIITPTAAVSAAQQAAGVNFKALNGSLLPLGDIIAELQPKLAGMPPTMAAAELKSLGFGSAANKLVTTIQAGPAAFDKDRDAIQKHNSAADAAKKATEGMKASFEKAKSGIEDAAIALGEKLMPSITTAAGDIAKFVAKVAKDWPEISKVISKGIDAVKPAFELLGKLIKDAFQFLIDHKPILIAALGAIAIAVFPVTSAVIILALAASEIVKHWSTIKGFFVDIWHGMYDAIKPVLGLLKAGMDIAVAEFRVAWDIISSVVKVAWDIIAGVVKVAFDIVKGIIEVGIDLITGHWSKAWGDIVKTVEGVGTAIEDALKAVFNVIVGLFKSVWDNISGGASRAINGIVSFFGGLPGKVAGAIGDFFSVAFSAFLHANEWILNHVITPVVGFFASMPGSVAGAIGDFFTIAFAALTKVVSWINTNVWTPVSSFFIALPGKVAGLIGDFFTIAWTAMTKVLSWLDTNVWQPVSSFFTGLPGKVAGAIGGFYETAFGIMLSAGSWVDTNVIQPIVGFFTKMPGTIASDFSNFISTIFSGIGNVASWVNTYIVDPIVNAIKAIPGKIGSIGGQILGDITGGLGSLASHIPGLAAGGYVTSPTLAMVGEAGPEFVIPESLLNGNGAGVSALAQSGGINLGSGISSSAWGASQPPAPTTTIVTQPVQVVLNGQMLGQAVQTIMLQQGRAQGNVLGQYAGGSQTGAATGINTNAVPR